jgi:hypothetical protein
LDDCLLGTACFFNNSSGSNLGKTFSSVKIYVFILRKNGLGYILSDLFTNAPGRPDAGRQRHSQVTTI